jgi:siroheme synthase-like protein
MTAKLSHIAPVEADGPLMVAWQIDARRALVVGGGTVSTRRVRALLRAGAEVHLVAPRGSAEVRARAARGEMTMDDRRWAVADLDHVDLVLVAIDDPTVSARIAAACRARRIPVHVADNKPLCDFYFPAVHREGPVQIAVSTGGAGPALADRLRDRIAAALPREVGEAVERFGQLRAAVRAVDPETGASRRRMRWLNGFGREASWPDLAALSDADLGLLVRRYLAETASERQDAPWSSEASASSFASTAVAR